MTLCPVATPVLTIVAALRFEDTQVTESVITVVLPSARVPVASKGWVSPDVMEAVVGLTVMDCRLAIVTLTVVELLIVPDLAVMLAAPAETPVTNPPLLIIATEASDDVQVTELVMALVLESL